MGLGLGISSVCAQAYYDSHRALLFFDQDTIFSADTLNTIEEFFKTNHQLAVDYSAVVFNASNLIVRDSTAACFKDVVLARNSGSLFLLNNLKKIQWHNENYFVDGVDYEFCLRSRRHGLKIGEYSCTPGFDHEAEQGGKKYIIFGKTLYLRKYALSRVADVVYSSIKIVAKSLLLGEIRFAARIMNLLFIYVTAQICARLQRI